MSSFPGAFSQIVTNLLMNSLIHAYNEEDSGQIKLDFKREGEEVILQYSDDGKGINSENMSKIFDPFFTTNRSQGGTD